jgi:hypothetical protein
LSAIRDLDRFYQALGRLASFEGQGQQLRTYGGRLAWPSRGVYFFQEPGEHRAGSDSLRIVRVGTHALGANARSKLWGRLRAHRGSRDGRGNHRGSIFRLHVGAAMLERDGNRAAFATWGAGQSASRLVRDAEVAHEKKVSAHIGSMRILWVDVPDEAGPQSVRGYIERNAIGLLSNRLNPGDPPSESWLGKESARAEIRESGLWNLNHVADPYEPQFLDHLEALVDGMAWTASGAHIL